MKVEIKHPHYVPLGEALLRIKTMIDKKRRENPNLVKHIEWKYTKSQGRVSMVNGKAHGKFFEGELVLSEDLIHLTLDISWLFRPALNIITTFIKDEFKTEFHETEQEVVVEKRHISSEEDKENVHPNTQQNTTKPFQSPTKKARLGSPNK